MTDTTARIIADLIGTIPSTVAAVLAALIGWGNRTKVNEVKESVAVVHDSVNGNLSKVKEELAAAKQEVVDLKALITLSTPPSILKDHQNG